MGFYTLGLVRGSNRLRGDIRNFVVRYSVWAAAATLAAGVACGQDREDTCSAGGRLFTQGQRTAAIEALKACVAGRPANAEAWAMLGAALASEGDYESAEKPFRTACDLQSSLPNIC